MNITIVGGGAAGLISAIYASYNKKGDIQITILERLDRVGKKILSTGNGRCNFTNIHSNISNFYGKNPEFTQFSLEKFTPYSAIDFFESLGVIPKAEDDGKVYPYSLQATAILDVLRREIDRLGVIVITNCNVNKIEKNNDKFHIYTNQKKFIADKVILAAGGCASPVLGSDGSGFNILKNIGHKITPVSPALVQLKTENDSKMIKSLKGIKILAKATLKENNSAIKTDTGEVLFTDYGLSGPPIFQISCQLKKGNKYSVSLDLMPDINKKELFDFLKKRCKILKYYTMEDYFTGVLNKKLGFIICKKSGIEKLSTKICDIDNTTISNMTNLIKNFELDITGTNGFKNAQVTAGGAVTSEFNEKTMESKILKGLYCAGEILDIYGDCGGHNLQWAWASGYLAGISAVK